MAGWQGAAGPGHWGQFPQEEGERGDAGIMLYSPGEGPVWEMLNSAHKRLFVDPSFWELRRDLMSDDTNGNFSNVQLDQMSMECLM